MKGDSQEVNSIVELFCPPRRKGPLLIGSTKSNMGHPEPAGGWFDNEFIIRSHVTES